MAKSDAGRPLIIRRVKKVSAGHHGGAWKVAYADFVTAMMAFFLLMWLLNATSEEQRKGIADYFDPTIPISRTSAGGVGMLSGESIFSKAQLAGMHDRGIKRRPTDPQSAQDEAMTTAGTDPANDAAGHEAHDPSAGAPATEPAAQPAIAMSAAEDSEAALGRAIEAALAEIGDPTISRHFRLRITPEGLVIEIVDLSDQPLFAAGSAEPSAVLHTLLGVLVPLIEDTTNDIAVIGHTDALPFGVGAAYTNWELSADRANTARRMIGSLGLPPERIVRISGLADTDPFDHDPAAAQNRRIAIIMLRKGRR